MATPSDQLVYQARRISGDPTKSRNSHGLGESTPTSMGLISLRLPALGARGGLRKTIRLMKDPVRHEQQQAPTQKADPAQERHGQCVEDQAGHESRSRRNQYQRHE